MPKTQTRIRRSKNRSGVTPSGFTLIELLVAIGILVVLAGILVPVVSTVRTRAREADTLAFINQLDSAINRYHTDFRAYPGPFSDSQIANVTPKSGGTTGFTGFAAVAATGFANTPFTTGNVANSVARVTGSENLVLGLLGGLRPTGTAPNFALGYDPSTVGQGPASLNPGRLGRTAAYLDTVNLSFSGPTTAQTGLFSDDAGAAFDTIIPEFVDRFGDPMPILYLRSRLGVSSNPSSPDALTNTVVSASGLLGAGAYNMSSFVGYTTSTIGTNKSPQPGPPNPAPGIPTFDHGLNVLIRPPSAFAPRLGRDESYTGANATVIGDVQNGAYVYLRNPVTNSARNKDRYILISPGRDRVYGTGDDITNFGRF